MCNDKSPGVYFMPKYGPNRHFQLKVVSLLVSMCVGGCMQYPDRCIMAPLGAVQVGGRGSFSRTSLVQASLIGSSDTAKMSEKCT